MRIITSGLCVLAVLIGGCGGGSSSSSSGSGGSSGGGVPPLTLSTATSMAGITALSGTSSSPVTPYVSDSDSGKTYTFAVLSQPANGTATVVNNRLVYTPNLGFGGVDSFGYRVTDSANQYLDATARARVYGNNGLSNFCKAISTVNGDGTLNTRTSATPCAFYGEVVSRVTSIGTPVTIRYQVHRPSTGTLPKAVVILINGGNLSAALAGDPATGVPTSTSAGFLNRSAQLIADAGYLAIAIDRPTDRVDDKAVVDAYRVSVDHAVDILSVLRLVNTDNLPLILSGISRGAISVVANNLIASGIALASPVTSESGGYLYVGRADTPNLLVTFVQRPTRLLWHEVDACGVTKPTDSQNLSAALNVQLSGIGASSQSVTGGVVVTSPLDVCGGYHYHSFLGIEPTVVTSETSYLDSFINSLPANKIPKAAFTTAQTGMNTAKNINLSTLSSDADNDTLSYALSHTATSLGGSVTLSGSTVTYTPPTGISNQTDYFVYVVTDGKGGVRAAVATVNIGS